MHTLLQCIYYDLAGKDISLEGRHLVLTLLASSFKPVLKERVFIFDPLSLFLTADNTTIGKG